MCYVSAWIQQFSQEHQSPKAREATSAYRLFRDLSLYASPSRTLYWWSLQRWQKGVWTLRYSGLSREDIYTFSSLAGPLSLHTQNCFKCIAHGRSLACSLNITAQVRPTASLPCSKLGLQPLSPVVLLIRWFLVWLWWALTFINTANIMVHSNWTIFFIYL